MSLPPLNVLWIMSDQHHAECWQVGGRPEVQTPALAGLARDGIVFERAYCNNPICAPSRACFLTGQYVCHHGVSGNQVFNFPGRAETNLGRYFGEAGYETALIGKGHLPKAWMEEGFSYRRYCDLADGERDDPCSVAYFDYLVRHGLADRYDLGTLPAGHPGASMRGFVSEIPLEHSVEAWTGREAVQFLRDRSWETPFFLQLSFQRPHDPYAPSPESVASYDPALLRLPESFREVVEQGFQHKPLFQQEYVRDRVGGYPYVPQDEADLRRQLAFYYSLISVIDEQIGAVLEELRRQGRDGDTIVVYHADHGDFAGDHGLMLKNLGIYESIHRIPFIIRYPGAVAARESRLIESVDLFPTVCHLAGLPIPDGLDGNIVVGPQASFREHVVCEWDFPVPPQRRVVAVRTERYRLVYYHDAPEDGEFYDCAVDPVETDNLFHDPAHAAERERCYRLILKQLSTMDRRHSCDDDFKLKQLAAGLTRQIHKHGAKWSEINQS